MTDTWKAFFPEDGETVDDAWEIKAKTHPITQRPMFMDAEDAAQRACEMDYDERDGWERSRDTKFLIIIIDPKGVHHSFTGWHEPTVDHLVEEVT
jgi:hypothetical protein